MDFYFNIITQILIFFLLFIGLKYLETFWYYPTPKPYVWLNAVKNKKVSKNLKSIESRYYDKIRFYIIWFQIERLRKENIEGDFAELGVHKGETAKLIYEMDTSRNLHLFDTFEGFNEIDLQYENNKGGKYTCNEFSDTNLQSVKKYINPGINVFFYPGYFPDTAAGLKNIKFSFVNLDADLYKPTLHGLKFFYERLSPGGVIIIHDYNHTWDGIKRALDEFLPTIPESLIELPDWQGSAMIVKNKITQVN